MTQNPKIAGKAPVEVQLTAGEEIWFCTCGHSENQPFCDGSHKKSGFSPLGFTPEKSGSAWLCQCKQSKNLPFCDGSHQKLP
ncbi:MAG: CDGSH iron-sulfur domain-containing protein [Kiritimatiellia bacterium]